MMKMLFVFAILILIALELYLLELWREYEQKQGSIWNVKQGLDLSGGVQILYEADKENVTEEDHAKMMAAVYRFQNHVSVIDGLYSCSLKNGAEINISEELFKSMIDNLEEMNSFIKEYTEKGEKVNVIEPTEEYLESLLK